MIQTTLFPDTFKAYNESQIASEALFDASEAAPSVDIDFSNDDIANMFEQIADLLAAQGDDYYRIRAYREGARSVRASERSVIDMYRTGGLKEVQALPYIGDRLSRSIQELATTGELKLLERLLIDVSPEDLFTTVPGIGQLLARRIYRELRVMTLEELEQAAYDGTLEQLEGFGTSRVKMVRVALETMLGRTSRQRKIRREVQREAQREVQIEVQREAQRETKGEKRWRQQTSDQASVLTRPSEQTLLAVDQQYRYLAKAGQLRMVTPKRFNPDGKRWLPVMRLKKDGWLFNALYSNTARAHDLGKTHDWVVVYYESTQGESAQGEVKRSGQCTVVTETRGDRRGQRVIRGMESAAA